MKNMYYLSSYLLLLITITAIATPTITSATTICLTYSTSASISSTVNPSPVIGAVTIFYMKTTAVRLLDSTKVSLFLSVPNPQVHLLAPNHSLESRWVYRHVPSFHPRTKISIISVGNDVVSYSPDASPFFLPAMRSAHQSFMDLRIYKISVSATFSIFNIIPTTFTHSSAQFQQPNGEMIIRTTLRFVYYLPAGVSAMATLGHESLPVIVAETGWLSSRINASEVDATLMYIEMYLKALFTHPISGSGTPLRKGDASEVYIFELVVKQVKQGFMNRGFVHRNMTNKYSSEFLDGGDA